jgi:hypothetical protein
MLSFLLQVLGVRRQRRRSKGGRSCRGLDIFREERRLAPFKFRSTPERRVGSNGAGRRVAVEERMWVIGIVDVLSPFKLIPSPSHLVCALSYVLSMDSSLCLDRQHGGLWPEEAPEQ